MTCLTKQFNSSLLISNKVNTHFQNWSRLPVWARSITLSNPPTRIVPRTATQMTAANMSRDWSRSVQTTALIPPVVQYNVQTIPTDIIDVHLDRPVTAESASAGAYSTIPM